jgi:hypothetical protein
MDIEARMPPQRQDEMDNLFADLAFPQKHLEHLLLKELLQ